MWRKFLGVGIPMLVLGLIFYIIAISQIAYDPWGGGDGMAALSIIGIILMVPGFMLANAGLIGAAVGADIRGRTQPLAFGEPAVAAPSCPGCAHVSQPDAIFCGSCGLRLAD
jgi:hypothetical protein